jgi:hypothetical protein
MRSLTAFTLIASVQAGLRFPCSTLTFQRLDPAAQPGSFPSAHVHHIVGGNAFNATMNGDVGARATCTTCQMADDFSNYWTATLYFKHPTNGSYHRVQPIPVQPLLGGSNGAQGGLTVYYTQFDLNKDNLGQQKVKAFPPVSNSKTSKTRKMINLASGIQNDRWDAQCNLEIPRGIELPMHVRRQPRDDYEHHADETMQWRDIHHASLPTVRVLSHVIPAPS